MDGLVVGGYGMVAITGDAWINERAQEILTHGLPALPSEVRSFDPSLHPHDPHNGEFIDTPGGAVKDLLKLAGKIDLADGEHLVASNKLKMRDGNIFTATTRLGGQRHLRFGLPEFDASSGEALPWQPDGPYTANLDQRGIETLRQGFDELDQMGRERVKKARAIADRMDAVPQGSPAYKAAQHEWFQIAGDGQLIGEGSVHGTNGTDLIFKMTMDQEPSVQIAARPPDADGWNFDEAVQNGDGGLDLSLAEFRRLRRHLDALIE
jgi:hypothetical protein